MGGGERVVVGEEGSEGLALRRWERDDEALRGPLSPPSLAIHTCPPIQSHRDPTHLRSRRLRQIGP